MIIYKYQIIMKVHFTINWSGNILFNAGERFLTIHWLITEGFPREGQSINIPKFIQGDFKENEVFSVENKERNVFDWIENTEGWRIEKVKWEQNKGEIYLEVLVCDGSTISG